MSAGIYRCMNFRLGLRIWGEEDMNMSDKPFSILLVEDSGTDAFTVKRILKRHLEPACLIRHAENMADAQAMLNQHRDIELVLLDLHLPDTLDEKDTFRRLENARRTVPVVILTAMKDYALAVKIVKDGASEFVDKSLVGSHPEIICDIVNFTIRRYRAAIPRRDGLSEQIG